MPIRELHVSGYRSIRDLRIKFKRINVLVGPNGCGKSNLYRTLFLVAAAAKGTFATELAGEGGIPSLLWAGRRNKLEKPRMRIEVTMKEFRYTLECGRIPLEPDPDLRNFVNDPDIKLEEITYLAGVRQVKVAKRMGNLLTARNMDGRPIEYPLAVLNTESILSGLRDPQKFPDLSALRYEFLNWRFYHQFRTDIESPLRQPQPGVMTPVLANDGIDVAAALETIRAIGDKQALETALQDAFPGAELRIFCDSGVFSFLLQMPFFQRSFSAVEISDGTLQYICLLAALLSPRPPALLALNEPETSIHPDLLEPLAKLIIHASKHSQIWITTHSRDLASFIARHGGNEPIELTKIGAQTMIKKEGVIEEVEESDEIHEGDFFGNDKEDEPEYEAQSVKLDSADEEEEDDDY